MIREDRVHQKIENILENLGWQKLPEEVFTEHHLIENYILEDIFVKKIEEINTDVLKSLKHEEIEEVINTVKNALLRESDPVRVLDYLKNGVLITVKGGPLGKREIRINLISYDEPFLNAFHYGHETKYKGFPENSKPDFTLFVNGIPVVIIEAKKEIAKEETVNKAISDIREYEVRSPKLFNFVQFAVAYGDRVGYLPVYPNIEKEERSKGFYIWKDELKQEDPERILDPLRVLEFVKGFIFFVSKKGKLEKIVPRYMQYWAVKRAIKRIEDYLSGGEKGRGLIWHWQGSGKTYEIVYLAEYFINRFLSRHPHVFVVIDREDLEDQMSGIMKNIKPAKFTDYFRVIESVEDLKETLKRIKEQEKNPSLTFKGVYLVMAHKFQQEVYRELEEIGSITKKEILILRDEAHRTEYGILASVRKKILEKALSFGFTGTPISRRDKNTFREFAYPEEGEFYLDKYFVEDSIRDGFTLEILWRSLKHENIYVTKEMVREVLRELGVETVEVKPQEIRQRVSLKDYLESQQHVRRACEYIVQNLEEDTEGFRFKAFVVAVSRLACVRYKRILEEMLIERFGDKTKGWAEVVMTYTEEDEEEIKRFRYALESRYSTGWKYVNQRLREKFLEENSDPRILIVTDMLLTGYDADILKVMYLDKPMRDHILLQAVARVNRPKEGKKCGLVVDLTGILIENYTKAVVQYNIYEDESIKEDLSRFLFVKVEKIWESFLRRYSSFMEIFEKVTGVPWEDFIGTLEESEYPKEIFEEVVPKVLISSELERILEELKETINLFKAVGAYPDKVSYYEKVLWLEVLYSYIMKKLRRKITLGVDIERIKKMVMQKLRFNPLEEVSAVKFDAETFEKLKGKKPAVILVADLLYTLIEETEDRREPFLKILYEQLRRIKERLTKEGVNINDILNDLIEIKKQKEDYDNRLQTSGLTEKVIYNLRFFFKVRDLKEAERVLRSIESKNLITHSDWNRLKKALHKDLMSTEKDPKERDMKINMIVEEFVKPFMEAHLEKRRSEENV